MKNGKPTDLDVAFQNPNTAVYLSEEKTTTINFTTDGGATWETVKHKPTGDRGTGGNVRRRQIHHLGAEQRLRKALCDH